VGWGVFLGGGGGCGGFGLLWVLGGGGMCGEVCWLGILGFCFGWVLGDRVGWRGGVLGVWVGCGNLVGGEVGGVVVGGSWVVGGGDLGGELLCVLRGWGGCFLWGRGCVGSFLVLVFKPPTPPRGSWDQDLLLKTSRQPPVTAK